MSYAPIALFVYNRPEHTQKVLAALAGNFLAKDSELFVFSDGSKDTEDSRQKVLAVRQLLKKISGFKAVQIIEREKNFGLAASIISGVTDLVKRFGRVIVLEDDLITSPYFLEYLNTGLDLYEQEEQVISLHGYMYPVKAELPETFFIKGADCWGWATWKRGWDLFEADGRKLLQVIEDKKLTKEFDLGGAYPYTLMLRSQIKGLNNSWAIRWYASAFISNKLTLYPKKSLVAQIGFDNSGTHGGRNNMFQTELYQAKIIMNKITSAENLPARRALEKFFKLPPNRLKIFLSKCKNYWRYILS